MFDPTRPFKKISSFDAEKPFKVIDQNILKEYVKPAPKAATLDEIEGMIATAVRSIPKPKTIEKIIEKQIIKEIEKKETREFAEAKTVEELKKQIEALKKDLDESKRQANLALALRGGSGVIGIPPPEPNPVNYVLTVNSDKKAQWKASQGGSGGGIAPGTFTITNATQNFSLDVQNATVDQLYQVVGTLIQKLQGDI